MKILLQLRKAFLHITYENSYFKKLVEQSIINEIYKVTFNVAL